MGNQNSSIEEVSHAVHLSKPTGVVSIGGQDVLRSHVISHYPLYAILKIATACEGDQKCIDRVFEEFKRVVGAEHVYLNEKWDSVLDSLSFAAFVKAFKHIHSINK
jgi:hypothetical protein